MPSFRVNVHLGGKDPLIQTDDISDGAITLEKTSIEDATSSLRGFMSASDKDKLDKMTIDLTDYEATGKVLPTRSAIFTYGNDLTYHRTISDGSHVFCAPRREELSAEDNVEDVTEDVPVLTSIAEDAIEEAAKDAIEEVTEEELEVVTKLGDIVGKNYLVFDSNLKYVKTYTETTVTTAIKQAFQENTATSSTAGMMSATDKANLDTAKTITDKFSFTNIKINQSGEVVGTTEDFQAIYNSPAHLFLLSCADTGGHIPASLHYESSGIVSLSYVHANKVGTIMIHRDGSHESSYIDITDIKAVTDQFFMSELVLNENTNTVEGTREQIAAVHGCNKTPLIKCSRGEGYIVCSPCYSSSSFYFSFEHLGKIYYVTIDYNDNITTTCFDSGKATTVVDLADYLDDPAILPFNANYLYNDLPTHHRTVNILPKSALAEILDPGALSLVFCTTHIADGTTSLVFIQYNIMQDQGWGYIKTLTYSSEDKVPQALRDLFNEQTDATTASHGLMSISDKKILDNLGYSLDGDEVSCRLTFYKTSDLTQAATITSSYYADKVSYKVGEIATITYVAGENTEFSKWYIDGVEYTEQTIQIPVMKPLNIILVEITGSKPSTGTDFDE